MWVNNKLMNKSLSWGYCMEQEMRNGARGFPAFQLFLLSSQGQWTPKIRHSQGLTQQGPSAGVAACFPLSMAATLRVCQAELTTLEMMGKRRYGEGIVDLSPPPGIRLILTMDLIGDGVMGRMEDLTSLSPFPRAVQGCLTTAKCAMKWTDSFPRGVVPSIGKSEWSHEMMFLSFNTALRPTPQLTF